MTQAEQLWRWCRRNPVVASLTAALLLLFASGFAGVTWQWHQTQRALAQEAQARGEAENQTQAARQASSTISQCGSLGTAPATGLTMSGQSGATMASTVAAVYVETRTRDHVYGCGHKLGPSQRW